MGEIKVKNIILIVAVMLMATIYLPVFSIYASQYIGHYSGTITGWTRIWFGVIILFASRSLIEKTFVYVILLSIVFDFVLMNTLWKNVDEWNQERGLLSSFIVPISLYGYFRITKDFDGLVVLLKWTLGFIAVTAILSIITSIIDPMYARKSLGGGYTPIEFQNIRKFGGGGYGFAEALVCLFPIIVYYYKNESISPYPRSVLIIFGILIFITLLRLQFFATIIVSFIGILLAILGRRNIKWTLIYLSLSISIIVIIPTKFYSYLIIEIGGFFDPKSDVYYKLNEIDTYLKFENRNDSEISLRLDRYELLWDGFTLNPITGFYNSESSLAIGSGGHLFWMNKLTVYGLLGFLSLVFFIYFYINNAIKQFDTGYLFYYMLSVFSGIGLGLIKNLEGMDFWTMFFFVVPGLYFLSSKRK